LLPFAGGDELAVARSDPAKLEGQIRRNAQRRSNRVDARSAEAVPKQELNDSVLATDHPRLKPGVAIPKAGYFSAAIEKAT